MATAANIIPSLTALESHPEFQRGLADAQEQFLEEYASAPLTEDQIINEVEASLGHRVTERSEVACHLVGEQHSYFYNLGFVFGTINKGLAYAPAPC